MRTEGSPAELEHRRRLAVQRVLEGYATEEVADFLGVSQRAVRLWVAAFLGGGDQGLAARPVSGRPPKLSPQQEAVVLNWLFDSPTKHGFTTELWTAPRLALLIEQHWAIHFHPRSLNAWLRMRGITPQRPHCVSRDRDPEKIAAWLRSDWPRICHKAHRRDAFLAWIDESGLLLTPLLRRSQAPRGHRPVFSVRLRHREHVSVAAALWLSPERDTVGLVYRTLLNGYFNSGKIASFLHKVLRRIPGAVVALWNGGPMHKGPAIRAVEHMVGRGLCLEPMPPYAPELNPVEQLWDWLKYIRLCNFPAQNGRHLFQAVVEALEEVRFDQHRLKGFFHASALPQQRKLLL